MAFNKKLTFNKRFFVVVCTAAIAISSVGCEINSDTPVIGRLMKMKDDEVIKVGASICTVDEAKLVLMNLQNQYKNDFGGQVSWSQKMGNTTLEEFVLNKVQSDLSIVYAMSSLAEEEEITLTDDEKSLIEKAAKEYCDGLNDSEIEYANVSTETVESLYTNYYLADKVYADKTAAVSDEISDEEARVMKIQYIYIDTSETASEEAKNTLEEIKTQVESGSQDFLVQANKYSDTTPVQINIKKNEATELYQQKAFELTDGAISDVIIDDDGAYIVRCVNSYLERQTQNNKKQILLDNKIAAFEKIYNSYVEDNTTDMNEEAWEKIQVATNENVNAGNLFEIYEKYMSVESE